MDVSEAQDWEYDVTVSVWIEVKKYIQAYIDIYTVIIFLQWQQLHMTVLSRGCELLVPLMI